MTAATLRKDVPLHKKWMFKRKASLPGFPNVASRVVGLNAGITRQMANPIQFNEGDRAAQDHLSLLTYPNATRKQTFKPSTL